MKTKTNTSEITKDRTEVAVERFVRRFGLAWDAKAALYRQAMRRGWDGSEALAVAFRYANGRCV